jgi:hypothetical protein
MDAHPRTTLLLQLPVRAEQLDRPPSGVARHVLRVAAWARLEHELRSIAVDLLGPNESDDLPAAYADWVAATTQAAISGVCEAALDGLVQALDSLLIDVPPDVARRLDEARVRHDAGLT